MAFIKKIWIVFVFIGMSVVLIACQSTGTRIEKETVIDTTEEKMANKTGIDLTAPNESEYTKYAYVKFEDGRLASQLVYCIDGDYSMERACSAWNNEEDNILGYYDNWDTECSKAIESFEAVLHYNKDGEGYISFFDKEHGILYNLYQNNNANEDTLTKNADKLIQINQ